MTIELNYEGLDEATTATLQSEAVQKLIAGAIEKAEAPLKATRDALLGEKKALKIKVDEMESLGGLEALKKVPEIKEDVSKKTKAEETYAEQVKALQQQLTDMKNQSVQSKLAERLSREIREADGAPELLEHHVKLRIQHSVDEQGNLKVVVLDKNGVEMFVNGKEATVKDLMAEFKATPTFQPAFKANPISGASTKTSERVTAANPFATATRNVSEQGRLVKTNRSEAVRLANEAGAQIKGLNAQ